MKLRTDDEDNVYFLDIVYKLLVRQIGSQIDRTHPDNLLILKTEKNRWWSKKNNKLLYRFTSKKSKRPKK